MSKLKKIHMFKDGEWIDWDGNADVQSLLVTETMTLGEVKKHFPDQYDKFRSEQFRKAGDLVSDCCKADFNPWGYEKEEGIWQERCLKCNQLCEPVWTEGPN